ncbi:hypothetical protein RQP46_007373 [Phenoliferia psychrophenolica]
MHGILALSVSIATLFKVAAALGVDPPVGMETPIDLGRAGDYAIIAKTGVSTVPQSTIKGDMAISPVAQTYYTGFSYTEDSSGTYATSGQVAGKMYSATDAAPTPSKLTTAISDMETAFVDGAGRSRNPTLNVGAGTVSGYTFHAGLYTWGTTVQVTGDCYVNAGPNDVVILQIASELIVAAGIKLIVYGGIKPQNIFWVVSGAVTFGSTSSWYGIVLGKTAVHQITGASIKGRLLALDSTDLDVPTAIDVKFATPATTISRRKERVLLF